MPEIRLIDANAAADKIMRETEKRADDLNMIGIALMICFARMLRDENDFPTIEAEPVRHGRWIPQESGYSYKCSRCGHEVKIALSELVDPRDYECYLDDYCGGCGAKMDERMTSLTAGDATRAPHYIHGPGVKKDDLLQRLGKLEDAIEQINGIIIAERNPVTALRKAGDVIADLDREKRKKVEW